MNGCLRGQKYDEKKLFGECCGGHKVEELWKDYGEELKKKKGKDETEDAQEPVPTHAPQNQ